jgi:hypothetical protein
MVCGPERAPERDSPFEFITENSTLFAMFVPSPDWSLCDHAVMIHPFATAMSELTMDGESEDVDAESCLETTVKPGNGNLFPADVVTAPAESPVSGTEKNAG